MLRIPFFFYVLKDRLKYKFMFKIFFFLSSGNTIIKMDWIWLTIHVTYVSILSITSIFRTIFSRNNNILYLDKVILW